MTINREPINHRVLESSYRIEYDLYGPFECHERYEELVADLGRCSEKDVIILRVNSPGGRIDVGMMLIQALRLTKATTIAQIVWPSASMASVVALSCDGLYMNEDTHLMFHTYSSGSYGKSDELMQDVAETHKAVVGMMNKCITPFITKSELRRIADGKDLYVQADCPTLEARIKRHFSVQVGKL